MSSCWLSLLSTKRRKFPCRLTRTKEMHLGFYPVQQTRSSGPSACLCLSRLGDNRGGLDETHWHGDNCFSNSVFVPSTL